MYYNKQTSRFEKLTFSISRGYWIVFSGIAVLALVLALFTAIWAFIPATADNVTPPTNPPEINVSANDINSLLASKEDSAIIESVIETDSTSDQHPPSSIPEETQLDSQYISLLKQFEQSIGKIAWDKLSHGVLEITFHNYSSEKNYDELKIYDGPSTGFEQIGELSGKNLAMPLTYRSTNSYGSLTFSFRTDASGEYSGWDATARTVGNSNTPKLSYNMRKGSRKVGVVTYRDPNGAKNYRSNLDVVETLIAEGSESELPSALRNMFSSLGIERSSTLQKSLLNSLLETLEIYEQPNRGDLLNSYLKALSLGYEDFNATITLIGDHIKAIKYDDPVDMTERLLNWIVEDEGSPDFIRFSTDFIPHFEPDSQIAVRDVVVRAFFRDFDQNLDRLKRASNEFTEIQENITSHSVTESLTHTYLLFLEKEKSRHEKIEADQAAFDLASGLAEYERIESQAEKDTYKLTSLMVIGGAFSIIALFGLILLLFAILRTLKHIQSSLGPNNSLPTTSEASDALNGANAIDSNEKSDV
jgi:hypothetical protein